MALNFEKVIPINKEKNKECYKCGGKATHEVIKKEENIFTCAKEICMMEAIRQ